ncbi:MAG TPA: SCO family protein, partial [Gammaproteobacteria bacterium]|nr:SCO family protein [Gammaproteobacteria bacterium]
LTLAQIARATATLKSDAPELVPQVLFVSVDPARDSPDRIRAYLEAFDADFIGATADDAALAPLLQTLSVSVHTQTIDGEQYNVVHNGTIYVLDRNADWAALFGGSTHDAEVIVSDYLALQALAPSE